MKPYERNSLVRELLANSLSDERFSFKEDQYGKLYSIWVVFYDDVYFVCSVCLIGLKLHVNPRPNSGSMYSSVGNIPHPRDEIVLELSNPELYVNIKAAVEKVMCARSFVFNDRFGWTASGSLLNQGTS